jgi:hypothetical protein
MTRETADILLKGDYVTPSVCRCRNCKREFKAGGQHHWHNHFYCSPQCAPTYCRCDCCGGNSYQCFCER